IASPLKCLIFQRACYFLFLLRQSFRAFSRIIAARSFPGLLFIGGILKRVKAEHFAGLFAEFLSKLRVIAQNLTV
ncbi:MAG: hypothetical protein JWP57_2266, partial [Spirosoma sp.]|nr:hypothetical protein [Spirosoma sp.]